MKYNNIKEVSMDDMKKNPSLAAKEIGEGNKELENLIYNCIINDITTIQCCASHPEEEGKNNYIPYIVFELVGNEIILSNLISECEKNVDEFFTDISYGYNKNINSNRTTVRLATNNKKEASNLFDTINKNLSNEKNCNNKILEIIYSIRDFKEYNTNSISINYNISDIETMYIWFYDENLEQKVNDNFQFKKYVDNYDNSVYYQYFDNLENLLLIIKDNIEKDKSFNC